MREHIAPYRGRKQNGEWEYGFYVRTATGHFIVRYDHDSGVLLWFEVDPDTVGQDTGYFTSQEHGNGDETVTFIYEGDVARFEDNGGTPAFWVVTWDKAWGAWMLNPAGGSIGLMLANICEQVEIVGNRWDNPELLEA